MSHYDIDDADLARYLVGALPEEERALLDEMSVTSDDMAWRLRAAENDLVDAYVRGELSASLAEAFRSSYLATPHRRTKVALAAALAARTSAGETPHAGRFTTRHRWRILALAAAIGGIAIAGYFVSVPRTSEPSVPAVAATRPEPERGVAPSPPPAASAPTPAKAPLSTVAFVLAAPTRAAGDVETLDIPPGADRVVLRLELEADDYRAYRAEVRDLTHDSVAWRDEDLTSKTGRDGATVDVDVPSSGLESGTYSVELSGVSRDGVDELIAAYTFRVGPPE